MIIECTSCQARYQYNEDRFERKPSKKIKCAKCGTVFEIHNPAFASKPVVQEKVPSGDMTFAKRAEAAAKAATAATFEEPPPPERQTAKVSAPQMPSWNRLSLAVITG